MTAFDKKIAEELAKLNCKDDFEVVCAKVPAPPVELNPNTVRDCDIADDAPGDPMTYTWAPIGGDQWCYDVPWITDNGDGTFTADGVWGADGNAVFPQNPVAATVQVGDQCVDAPPTGLCSGGDNPQNVDGLVTFIAAKATWDADGGCTLYDPATGEVLEDAELCLPGEGPTLCGKTGPEPVEPCATVAPECLIKREYTVGYDNGITPGSSSNDCGARPNFVQFGWGFSVASWQVNGANAAAPGDTLGPFTGWTPQLQGWADYFNATDPNPNATAAFGFDPAPTWRFAEITGCDPDAVYGPLTLVETSGPNVGCTYTIYPVPELASETYTTIFRYQKIDCGTDTKTWVYCDAAGEPIEAPEDIDCYRPCGYDFGPYLEGRSECATAFLFCNHTPTEGDPVEVVVTVTDCPDGRTVEVVTFESWSDAETPDDLVVVEDPNLDCALPDVPPLDKGCCVEACADVSQRSLLHPTATFTYGPVTATGFDTFVAVAAQDGYTVTEGPILNQFGNEIGDLRRLCIVGPTAGTLTVTNPTAIFSLGTVATDDMLVDCPDPKLRQLVDIAEDILEKLCEDECDWVTLCDEEGTEWVAQICEPDNSIVTVIGVEPPGPIVCTTVTTYCGAYASTYATCDDLTSFTVDGTTTPVPADWATLSQADRRAFLAALFNDNAAGDTVTADPDTGAVCWTDIDQRPVVSWTQSAPTCRLLVALSVSIRQVCTQEPGVAPVGDLGPCPPETDVDVVAVEGCCDGQPATQILIYQAGELFNTVYETGGTVVAECASFVPGADCPELGESCDHPVWVKDCPPDPCPPPAIEVWCDPDGTKYVDVTYAAAVCGTSGTFIASDYYATPRVLTPFAPTGVPQICEDAVIVDQDCLVDECGDRWTCVTTINDVDGAPVESQSCVPFIENPDCDEPEGEGRVAKTERKAVKAVAAVKSIKLTVAVVNTAIATTTTFSAETGVVMPAPVGETCPCPCPEEDTAAVIDCLECTILPYEAGAIIANPVVSQLGSAGGPVEIPGGPFTTATDFGAALEAQGYTVTVGQSTIEVCGAGDPVVGYQLEDGTVVGSSGTSALPGQLVCDPQLVALEAKLCALETQQIETNSLLAQLVACLCDCSEPLEDCPPALSVTSDAGEGWTFVTGSEAGNLMTFPTGLDNGTQDFTATVAVDCDDLAECFGDCDTARVRFTFAHEQVGSGHSGFIFSIAAGTAVAVSSNNTTASASGGPSQQIGTAIGDPDDTGFVDRWVEYDIAVADLCAGITAATFGFDGFESSGVFDERLNGITAEIVSTAGCAPAADGEGRG